MAVLNEEQEMLRDMAREWTVNESPVTEFRKVRASGEPEAFNRDAYATMAQMGWAGVIIPEEHGGSDFGFLSAGLVVEELGKTLTASPLVMNTVAASAIVLGGSDEQKARWLPRLASGEAIATLAVDEGPSHDPAKIETSVSDGKLSGTKAFVHEAHGADLFVVAAKDGLYLVEKGDGVALTTSAEEDLSRTVMVTGFPPIKTDDTFESVVWKFGHIARASRGVRRLGSAALDLAYVATGRIDGFWEFNLNPWDTAAGYLLVEEAGGRVSQASGDAFTPFGKSVVATNGHIHDQLLDVLASADAN